MGGSSDMEEKHTENIIQRARKRRQGGKSCLMMKNGLGVLHACLVL